MKLSKLLTKEFIIPELKGETREDVISELIDLYKNDPRVKDIEKVRDAVMERERIVSTGVGKNIAIPHGKTVEVTELLCAFGKTTRPIDFHSIDDQPVYLVILLINKEDHVAQYIKILSRISRLLSVDEFREKLIAAKNAEEILELFVIEEEPYFEIN